LQIASFKTREQAMECVKELKSSHRVQPEKEYDPEDPNADREGYVWVISLSLDQDADKMYLCIDGCFR
jgi:flagellar basal body rod protein FlgC